MDENFEVIKARPHEKSYFVKDLSTNMVYLRPKNHPKLKKGYQTQTTAEARKVRIISVKYKMKSILKLLCIGKEKRSVKFCAEYSGDICDALAYA